MEKSKIKNIKIQNLLKIFKFWSVILIFAFCILNFSGCAVIFQKGRRTDIERIQELTRIKKELEKRLESEIADKKLRLALLEKGLVVTIVTDGVLFDSGRAEIRSEAYPILDKVADILIKITPDNYIGIEGHTDNEPIKYSPWKSNWELSTARALSVLHYLIDKKGISPERISATGYGEYRPVASNETKEGRRLNRRVEIVILPKIIKERVEQRPEEIPIKKVPPLK